MKKQVFDPSPILFFALILVLASCQERTQLKNNQTFGPFAGQDGGEININRFTRGDTPIWLGAMEDIEQLKLLLEDLDILPLSALSYFGEPVLKRNPEELISYFDLDFVEPSIPTNNEFYESGNLGLSTKDGQIMSLTFKEIDKVFINGVSLSELDILSFKKNYPKSYHMRNYYGDSYMINFSDRVPEVYDFAILKIPEMGKKLQLRWIDGEIIDAKLVGYD